MTVLNDMTFENNIIRVCSDYIVENGLPRQITNTEISKRAKLRTKENLVLITEAKLLLKKPARVVYIQTHT